MVDVPTSRTCCIQWSRCTIILTKLFFSSFSSFASLIIIIMFNENTKFVFFPLFAKSLYVKRKIMKIYSVLCIIAAAVFWAALRAAIIHWTEDSLITFLFTYNVECFDVFFILLEKKCCSCILYLKILVTHRQYYYQLP